MLTLVIYLKGGRKCDSKKSLESNHFLAIYNRKYQDSSWCKHNWLFNNFLAGPYNPYLNSLGGEDRIKEYLLAMHFLTKEFTILYFSGFHFENGHEGRQICSDINIKPLRPLTGRKQVSSSFQSWLKSIRPLYRARLRWWGQEYLKLSASAMLTQLDNHNCRLLSCSAHEEEERRGAGISFFTTRLWWRHW